jgi:16S rRNA (guanine527-N7)-methyltransferase
MAGPTQRSKVSRATRPPRLGWRVVDEMRCDDELPSALERVLAAAQRRGFLGPGPLRDHLEHSLAFVALAPEPPRIAVDLGSGGGIPGLVLAGCWPDSAWVLLEAGARRAAFLQRAVDELGLAGRVQVCHERAEAAGRDPERRGRADLVVARSFGPPAVVAECGAPLLRVGGALLVAEPPGGAPERWPADRLRRLGLVPDGAISEPRAIQRLRAVTPCPDSYPRRTGVPAKRPLFAGPD